VKCIIAKGVLGIFMLSMVFAFTAMASEGETGGEHHAPAFGKAEVFQMINFALLVVLLVYVYRKYAGGGFEKRSQQIKMAFEEAEHAKLRAEQKYSEYKARIDGLDRDIEDILTKAREEGQREHDHILQDARIQAEKIQRQAEMTAKQEVSNAQQTLREETINLAAELASGLLRKSANEDDHKRLVEHYLKKLGELN
jgi:F-type H+-transporting ATPase subunit b